MNQFISIALISLAFAANLHADECPGLTDGAPATLTERLRLTFEAPNFEQIPAQTLRLDQGEAQNLGEVDVTRLIAGKPWTSRNHQLSQGVGTERKIVARLDQKLGRIVDFDLDPQLRSPVILTDKHLLGMASARGTPTIFKVPVAQLGLTKIHYVGETLYAADRFGRISRVRGDHADIDVVTRAWGDIKDFAVVGDVVVVLTGDAAHPGSRLELYDVSSTARRSLQSVDVPVPAHVINVADDSILVGTDHGVFAYALATALTDDGGYPVLRRTPVRLAFELEKAVLADRIFVKLESVSGRGQYEDGVVLAIGRHGETLITIDHEPQSPERHNFRQTKLQVATAARR